MKRILCVILALGMAVMVGCAQEKPEAAARKIFEQQVAGHQGLELDTSGLAYHVVEQGEDNVLVEVSGNMAVKASLPLVKKNGQWVLAIPSNEKPEKEAETH